MKYRIDKNYFNERYIILWITLLKRAGFIVTGDIDYIYVQATSNPEDENILSALYDYEDFLEEVLEEDEEE